MKKTIVIIAGLTFLGIFSCKEEFDIKPIGQVRLEYPNPDYQKFESDCPFTFEYSDLSHELKKEQPCWFTLHYPQMKANIYLTYFPAEGSVDLASKIKDSERIIQEQTVKATFISPQEFEFPDKKVYGTLFELGGESAVNLQFHATDSLNNLLTGSVYFSTLPNYDSLRPAIQYVKRDVVHLIETLEWKNP
ncbi:MAG: gliding motility lipoprotein GldD [Weeksellaceae bacterium]